MKLVSAWTRARKALEAAGIDSPVLDSRVLVEAAAGVHRSDIVTDPYREVEAAAIEKLDALVARRIAREPISHILGRKEFWTLTLRVTPDVLAPRPETEHLVEQALELIAGKEAPRILDLGTGSGAILLALLAARPDATGVGVELSPAALAVAQENALATGHWQRATLIAGNWDESVSEKFDLVVSNPPYIASAIIDDLEPEVSRFEPRLALDGGADGLDAYRVIAPAALRVLKPGGAFAFEIGFDQASSVEALAVAAGLDVQGVRHDLAKHARVVYGRAPQRFPLAGE
jgi:release factor glutamine methyltransferase